MVPLGRLCHGRLEHDLHRRADQRHMRPFRHARVRDRVYGKRAGKRSTRQRTPLRRQGSGGTDRTPQSDRPPFHFQHP